MKWLKQIISTGFVSEWVPYADPNGPIEVEGPTEEVIDSKSLIRQSINMLQSSLKIDRPQEAIQRTIAMLERVFGSL